MSRSKPLTLRLYLLIATISLGLATIVKALQVSLTPEAWGALRIAGTRLLASSGFGVLLFATALVFLLSCAAAAWDRAERAHAARIRRIVEGDSTDQSGRKAA